MTTPRPDLPVEARLRQAARSYRLLAATLRRANPGRRAASQHAEVDVAPDGRVVALRVVSVGLGAPLARHFLDLAHAASTATGTNPDSITVTDVPQDPDQPSPGVGATRFQVPAGVDRQAPPAVMMEQLRATLRRQMGAVDNAAPRLAGLVGQGASTEDRVSIRVNSRGHLEGITISSWTSGQHLAEINDVLAQTLERATEDLRRQTQAVLDETGTR